MTELNPNLIWSSVIANQLAELGVRHVVIAAGSRSTPLSLAFASHQHFTVYSQVDERSAGFFALGIAKSTEQPVVLISTSGTATANFYPAVLEAEAAAVPLLFCTADRPHDLRISGANQTTDQVKLYGDHVNWFADVAPPVANITKRDLRYLVQLATSAYQYSVYPQKGPVHLNFPFKKPLQPTPKQLPEIQPLEIIKKLDHDLPKTQLFLGQSELASTMMDEIIKLVEAKRSVIIIAGPDAYRELSPEQLDRFISTTNVLALVDPLSGYRYTTYSMDERYIQSYETFLELSSDLPVPDVVLQVGMMPTSKYLSRWLTSIHTEWMVITARSDLTDGVLNSSIRIKADPAKFFDQLTPRLDTINTVEFNKAWIKTDQQCRTFLQQQVDQFEPSIIQQIFERLPESHLFVANSLAPRYFDQFVFNNSPDRTISIHSNRGVSGIDGTLSTALGIASTVDQPTYLITGDLAFYHDMNGLLAMMRYNLPLRIIIINNGGGAIFDRLPISSFNEVFDEFFLTKHQLHFDKIAAQFDVSYTQYSEDELDWNLIQDQLERHQQLIIEINTDPALIEPKRAEIIKALREQLNKI